MDHIQAVILAIIEGLTEFLPISSTGHMIIASSLMGIADDEFTKIFTVQIQFGAILSVFVLYMRRFFQSYKFYAKLLLAFIPAALAGILFSDVIDALLENVMVVACSLLVGGIILLFIDKIFKENETQGKEKPGYMNAAVIGIFQVIAMIPGVSRSAATIVGGLTQKLTRRAAAEFSFFLAVPTMFAASSYKLFKFYRADNSFSPQQIELLVIGNVVGFIVAILAMKVFVNFLAKYGFRVFGYYRIALGLTIIILYFSGINLSVI